MKRIDMTGERYGRWTVVHYIGNRSNCSYWLCECDCGNRTEVTRQNLRNKESQSCGCLELELRKARVMPFRKALASIHHSMMQRCYWHEHPGFKTYGARGIRVCEAWHDFNTYYNWAISINYCKGMQINRIDNNGNYSPSNCNLVTRKENMNNTLRTRWHEFFGARITASQLADKIGKPYHYVKHRIYTRKQTAEFIYCQAMQNK